MDARILTYNTQLRSWMMEVGWPPSLPPTYTAPDRAALIAKNILTSEHDYDIVCLNEVFDEDARDILSNELRGKYPYQVTKADLLYTRLVRPGLLDDISNKVFDLAFEPLLNVAALFALKLEDSGLFLASRWPFATIPLVQAVIDELGVAEAAALFPDGMLDVSFMTYGDCSGGDCRASKGVLHARLQQSPDISHDIFMSHTQADDDSVGENATERALQLASVWQFVTARVGGPPFVNPTYFLGDLNIVAGLADDATLPAEWQAFFATAGQPFTDHLQDQWGQLQCRGGSSGLTDPGFSADVRYPPLRQRLDEIVASTGPLVSQHVRIDWPLAEAPPGIEGISRLSDHRPLGVHLGRPHPHAAPQDALLLVNTFESDQNRLLGPGEVFWYRFDLQGTYEFTLDHDDPDVFYEIYLGSDLSNPQPPYRNETNPRYGTRYVLLAPFFVKVGNRRRDREFIYSFRSHRHEGASPNDAIHLIPTIPYPQAFPNAQQLNGDSGLTPWPDPDTKFFLVETPRVDSNRPISMSAELTWADQDAKLTLWVAEWDAPNPPAMLDDAGGDISPRSVRWQGKPGQTFLLGVGRLDPAHPGIDFTITAQIDISLLIGGRPGNPVLVCTDETSGWGADDIALDFASDTGWSRHVSNDELGDFDQDDVRDLWQYIPDVVSYEDGLTVTVIEEDDIDDDDVGSQTIPPFAQVLGWPQWTPIGPDDPHRITGAVTIDVDDGTYTFRCTLATWDPRV